MEKGVLKTFIKSIDTQLFNIVNNLICSICQELFYKPVTTPCGHSFCNKCIKRVLSSKDNSGCPLCKNPVKRYGLEADEVKSTLTEICQELPVAFEKDVLEITKNFANTEDLISTLKLSQIQNQECGKESNSKKQKAAPKRKTNKSKQTENDSETFIPVLKCKTKILEYPSAKKKKLDDLVSVSQTEPASNSSLCDSSELFKKLEKIEKIPPEEKISKWFSDVGDNIYINSPSSSILGGEIKPCSEGDKREEDKPTMIRRDYIKCAVTPKNEGEICKSADPYEFIPSQNNQVLKKKLPKKSVGKKIPDFKALQSFTKESIKRNTILLNESKEEGVEEDTQNIPKERQITASQKFEELLSETKKGKKKTHVLYSASQSSSTQFLDVSFHSKTETIKKKKTPRVQKKLLDVESVLFKNVELLTEEKACRRSSRCNRRSSITPRSERKKKLFSEIISVPSDEASELEKSVEKYLISEHKDGEFPVTKLGILLQELINDDVIYATRPANAPVRLPDLGMDIDDGDARDVTQNTGLIGFCTQEETSDEKILKKMVENIETELNSKEYLDGESEQKMDIEPEPKLAEENFKMDSPIGEDENRNCDSANLPSEIPKRQFIKFLQLGRLTPIRGRSKSTVVKLVFPIGLTSLARRHAFENRCAPLPQIPRKPTCQVSTGIQTSQTINSCSVQTSQVPRSSVNLQTSQETGPSVEVQTTQNWTATAEIQTSQRLVCQEIQTTQIGCQSMQIQTTQLQGQLFPNSISKVPETPNRKPSLQHRKIIQRKNPKKSQLSSARQLHTPEKQPADKDVIMDFGTEKEPDESWCNNQQQENLIEQNKKNKKQNSKLGNVRRKSVDAKSDDSDIQPFKRRGTFKILSQDSAGVLEEYETRQLIPLDVRKICQDEEMEVINLATSGSQNSDEQVLRVLKNIDLDLPKGRSGNFVRGEKSEESDSDFFVEQTPPRPTSRTIDVIKSVSITRSGADSPREFKESENHIKETSEGTDLIEDSLPKGFSESFLLLTAPHKTVISPDKNQRNESLKKTLKVEPTVPIDLPNENDQNKLNASEDKTKVAQLKAAIDAWKRTELASPIKTPPPKKLCVVASSVKNSETVKKFVSRFKIEYLNKPMKHMTHLIVGLHENEDRELLPLCTPKLLFAMANKKWVVSELWAETCLKMDMIVPEENFEPSDPVGGCGCRKARLSCEKLLKNCEIYLLGDFQMISKEDFAELITDCGGTLIPSPEKFSFLPTKLRMIIADKDCLTLSEKQLQDLYQKHSTVILSRDAIIMSVQSYSLVNFSPYLLHQASEENLVKLGYPLLLVRNEDDEDEDEEAYSRSVTR